MALDIAAMRAKLEAEENKSQNSNNSGNRTGDKSVFAHWNIPEDSTAIVRFLPDADDSNPYFWRDRVTRKIPFNAVEGVDLGNRQQVFVTVPDLNQFEKNLDPIQQEIGSWWEEGRQDEYRIYKKKFNHIYQGFVRVDPGAEKEEDRPENPIRRFIMAPGLHETIKAIIMNPKIKHLPTDFENGRDFEINSRKKGQWNNYDASQWSFDEDELTEAELEALEQHGLWDLSQYVFEKPDAEYIEAIAEMFDASVAGLPYEPARWGKFYKPAGVQISDTSTQHTVKKNEDDSDDTDDSESTTVEVEGKKTKDLLNKISKKEEATEDEPPFDVDESTDEAEEAPKEDTKTSKKKSSTADLLAKLQQRREEKAE